ncbi:MAG: cysteine desulfurase family protein [Patescibacteria group bacterium]
MNKNYIYFDNSATTKIDQRVINEMIPYIETLYGNPSSLHIEGQKARRVIDKAREIIASYIGSDIQEVIFTSGGTESNNTVINGVAHALKKKGNHIITTSIEHDSILKPLENLEGFDITYLKPSITGHISLEDLKSKIRDDTILISIAYANSEIGSIQDIQKIAEIAHEKGVLIHTDAMQAAKYRDINVKNIGVDLMTFGAHKINGPKGIGALFIKRGTMIKPLLYGGSQEYRFRGGTENTPLIAGFAKAVEILRNEKDDRSKYVKSLRDLFESSLQNYLKDIKINGSKSIGSGSNGSRSNGEGDRLESISNIYFKNVSTETMIINLDMKGIAASAGSACSSLSIEPSHVLTSIGLSIEEAKHSVRFSFGHENTESEIESSIKIIRDIYGSQL